MPIRELRRLHGSQGIHHLRLFPHLAGHPQAAEQIAGLAN